MTTMTKKVAGGTTAAGLALAGLIGPAIADDRKATSGGSSSDGYTIAFWDTTLRERNIGDTVYLASGVDKAHGRVIGYSALHGVFDEEDETFTIDAAVTLRRGILLLRFVGTEESGDVLRGTVEGGTGRFEDATGKAWVKDANDRTARVRVHIDG